MAWLFVHRSVHRLELTLLCAMGIARLLLRPCSTSAAFRRLWPSGQVSCGQEQMRSLPSCTIHACAASADLPPKKAAAMIIGNEILSGSITDTNTPWLAKLLFNQGVDLVRAEYVPDDKDDIISTVLRLKERVGDNGVIFSSGGIGPTHDDITYDALAAAFGAKLEVDEGTVRLMKEDYGRRGIELNASRMRMATLPTPSEVLRIPGLWVPLVNLEGVYVLPGIPKLFCRMVEAHKERFQGPAALSKELFTDSGEGDLADALTKVAEDFPAVTLGSYPRTDQSQTYGVKLVLQSRDREALDKACTAVEKSINTYRLQS